MPRTQSDISRLGRLLTVLLVAAYALVVVRNAWMHDDAYITFRTVDNFVHGYGLRWNPAERVQTYTHPLWMLLVTAVYAATHEIYFSVLMLSIVLSTTAVVIIVATAMGGFGAACLGIATLTLSKAFIDYSTSGLENPLSHVLLVAFVAVLARRDRSLDTLHALAWIAGLATLTRMDTVLFYAPALLLVWLAVDRKRGLAVLFAGFVPLLAWEAFSLFYYGVPFPNTAYAKLFETGVGTPERLLHGCYYLLNSVRLDPLTLLTVATALVAGFMSPSRTHAAIASGVALYLAYVVYIGGDFVTGRFLSTPLVGAVALLTQLPAPRRLPLAAATAVVLAVGLSSATPPPFSTANAGVDQRGLMDAHGVADERPYYYPYSGLLRAVGGVTLASHPWAIEGARAREQNVRVTVRGDIGYFGFYAGPGVHIVDVWGLADPLIARLPARADGSWRIGHFTRAVPEGYVDTLTSGTNRIADPRLARFYDELALITRGDLWDTRRFRAIWELNVRGLEAHAG